MGSDGKPFDDFGRPTFQSTLPAWGATRDHVGHRRRLNFNPRSPRGERRVRISALSPCPHFNPRSPRGERHLRAERAEHTSKISIHAPRVGSDSHRAFQIPCPGHFNPRSPRGERPKRSMPRRLSSRFQSTLPAWGATKLRLLLVRPCRISIHAPRVGSD